LRGRSHYQPRGTSANGVSYAKVFVQRVHQLLGHGYASMDSSKFEFAEEEDITGRLVEAVDAFLDKDKTPRWQWFSIHEDPRIHDDVRTGKRRLKLDIRIDSSQSSPRSRMCFEAKRLGPNHGTGVYLGDDGIKCLLDGRYARYDSVAGMLGYVQENSPDDWAAEIENAMDDNARELGVTKSGGWASYHITPELTSTYRTIHDRPGVGPTIEILHTLLLFN